MPNEIYDAVRNRAESAEVRELTYAGYDVNEPDSKKQNHALPLAAAQNRIDIVKTLLEAGAYVNRTDCNQRTALDYAKRLENQDIIDLLNGYSGQTSPPPDEVTLVFEEHVLSGNLEWVDTHYEQVETNHALIGQISLNLLRKLQGASNESAKTLVPVANFLYEHSGVYRAQLKSIVTNVAYDKARQLTTGFLHPFLINKNLAGFKIVLAHQFPLNSIQLTYNAIAFNALQMTLMLYENDETSLPFVEELMKYNAVLPPENTENYWYASAKRFIKTPFEHVSVACTIQSKFEQFQDSTHTQLADISMFFNRLMSVDSVSSFAAMINPNAPKLQQLITLNQPQTASSMFDVKQPELPEVILNETDTTTLLSKDTTQKEDYSTPACCVMP